MKISIGLPQLPTQNLTNLLGYLTQPETGDKRENDTKCPNCSTPYKRIKEEGYVGCSECYHNFNAYLEPILRKIHGTNRHSGKMPKRLGGTFMIKRQIEDLKKNLKQEVDKERYEEAARIRDEIIALEDRMARGDDK
jgi:protein arginine kinase activator